MKFWHNKLFVPKNKTICKIGSWENESRNLSRLIRLGLIKYFGFDSSFMIMAKYEGRIELVYEVRRIRRRPTKPKNCTRLRHWGAMSNDGYLGIDDTYWTFWRDDGVCLVYVLFSKKFLWMNDFRTCWWSWKRQYSHR